MRSLKRFALVLLAIVGIVGLVWALPFLFMQPGFTQELYAADPGFMGGVAFAPDGDVWITPCVFSGGGLRRFDAQTTVMVNGTLIHPLVASPASSTGCGITNHPDGFLYSNTSDGVTRQDGDTGAPAGGPFGPGGNALGITVHPITLELVYVGSDGTLHAVDPAFTTSRTFSGVLTGEFIDGIFFDPSGTYLLTATRTGGFRVSILLASDGSLVQHVSVPSEPDGIAFHASTPKFIVTNNTDGTMTRLDFPGDDFTQPPVESLFASGGFRGDLSQVGADGCLYLTQAGARYDDGTETGENSVVRICGGFAPPPGVSEISLAPKVATNQVGETHTVTATVTQDGVPLEGVVVTFEVLSGPNDGLTGMDTTDVNGEAQFSYTSFATGTDTIQASFVDENGMTQVSNPVTKEWTAACKELASAVTLGVGCGATMTCTPPVLGLPATISIDGNTPDAVGFIVASRPGGGGLFYQGCEIFVLPGARYVLATVMTDANGDGSFTGTVPFNLIKCGVQFTIQGIVLGDNGPTSVGEITNGVLLTLGS